jgi:hypothetical protein
MNYVTLNYATYNTKNYYLSIVILILYFLFISKLFAAIKFEIFNKRDVCDINFYYGKPCRNYISNNVLLDNRLLSRKQNFFDNANQNVTPTMDTDQLFLSVEERNINSHIKKHEKLISDNKDTVKTQFNAMTEALTYTVSTILNNFSNLLNVFNINNKEILNELGMLKEKISLSPGAINPLFQTISPITAPLQKLYRSLNSPSG